jgi:hypothetical protein
MKHKLFYNAVIGGGLLFSTVQAFPQSSNVYDALSRVEMLTGSNQISQVVEELIPELRVIYLSTTNNAEKLKILNYLATNVITRNSNDDEYKYLLLDYATKEYGFLQDSNKTRVWASDVLGRFLRGDSADLYKALALKKLMELQFLGGDQTAAKGAFDRLSRLVRSSQDQRFTRRRSFILSEALEEFGEAVDDPDAGPTWLQEKMLHMLQDPRNSSEDKFGFTIGLGIAYYSEGTQEKIQAAKNLFNQAMQSTTDSEQKLECLHQISYCCFLLADYQGAIAAVEKMVPLASSLSGVSGMSAGQIVGEAVSSVQSAFRREQKWNRLIAIRKLALDLAGDRIPPDQRYDYTAENGNDAKLAGDTNDAVAWYNAAFDLYPNSGRDKSDIVNLEIERGNVYALTNHLERVRIFEAIWAKYGSNEWSTTYNLGVNLAYEYYAAKDPKGKEFFSALLRRMDLHRTEIDSSHVVLFKTVEESCLTKLALWYMEDGDTNKMAGIAKRYLVYYPLGPNAVMAKNMLASAAILPRAVHGTAARKAVLVALTLITIVPLAALCFRRNSRSSAS